MSRAQRVHVSERYFGETWQLCDGSLQLEQGVIAIALRSASLDLKLGTLFPCARRMLRFGVMYSHDRQPIRASHTFTWRRVRCMHVLDASHMGDWLLVDIKVMLQCPTSLQPVFYYACSDLLLNRLWDYVGRKSCSGTRPEQSQRYL